MSEIPTKTSLDGRVTYQDISCSWLTAEDMRKADEQVAVAFSDWQVVVTGGPYRPYEVAYKVQPTKKVIVLDFYSARPGLSRVGELIDEMRGRLLLQDDEDTWIA